MKLKSLPVTLVMIGLALAIVEEMTYKSGSGGVLFGDKGYLKDINAMLPTWYVPGTKSVSVRYPNGYPIRLDGWLILVAMGMIAWRQMR